MTNNTGGVGNSIAVKQMSKITAAKGKTRGFEVLGIHNVSDPEFIKILTTTDGGVPDVAVKIVLPGAHISRTTQLPTGLVYIMEPTVTAGQILKHKRDLCGGVSMYDIQSIPLNSLEFFVKQIGRTFSTLPEFIADFSLFETRMAYSEGDQHSKLVQGIKQGRVLGEENCSISIVRSIDDDQEQHFHLVIKSYDPIATQLLHKSIAENAYSPINQVLSSPVYKAALLQGNIKRNAIACHLARVLDCQMINASYAENLSTDIKQQQEQRDVPLTTGGGVLDDNENMVCTITPTIEQHYNVLSKTTYQGRPMIAFYDGCFHIGEDRSAGVLLGLGRDVGYQYYWTPDNRMIRFGSDEYASAFPMGVPSQPQQQVLIDRAIAGATSVLDKRSPSSTSSNINNAVAVPEMKRQGITANTPAHVVWAGPFDLHTKNIAGSYDATYAKQSRNILQSLLGVEKLETCKMVTQGCYISSPIEEELSIVDLVKLRSRALDHVRLLHGCEFLKNQFMSCYYKYREHVLREEKYWHASTTDDQQSGGVRQGVIPTLASIILKEDLYFCYLEPHVFAQLVEYM